MIAGIMQPYFFPYFGYFDHIALCDTWVVFDITQYTPKSWMTRNRVLHPTKGWQYVIADVNGSRSMMVENVLLCNPFATETKILGQLMHYKKYAPYYANVIDIVKKTFANTKSNSLTDVSISGLAAVCAYLSIPFSPVIASNANYSLLPIQHAGQWALEICSLIGATTYINTPGGRHLFYPKEFSARGIQLGFTGVPNFEYACTPYEFEPHLSILDVLMWNSPEQVRANIGKTPVDYV